MDKRLVIAAGLSVLILLGWGYLFPPPKPPQTPATPREIATGTGDSSELELGGAQGLTGPADEEPEPLPEIETDPIEASGVREIQVGNSLFAMVLTNRGGLARSWTLLEYTSDGGEPLELLPQFVDGEPMMLGIELDDVSLAETFNEALYRVERTAVPGETGSERVTFSWADGRGLAVRKTLVIHAGSYLIDVQLEVTDRGRRVPARLAIGPGFGAQESGTLYGYYESQALWNQRGTITRQKRESATDNPSKVRAELKWAGLEDQYFAALVLPGENPTDMSWRPVDRKRARMAGEGDEPEREAELVLGVGVPESGAQLYVGPKKYTLLRELGHELERAVWFSSYSFLSWIARFIFLCLIWIYEHTIPNYGVAIILSTFLLRLILFPVNQYSMVSMKRSQVQMQRLQPKIKAIKAKYKKSKDAEGRNKMNQEMMELYRKEGVNPMGGVSGCLPLLAQFPILMGFYFMLTVAVELRGAPFLGWITDLSKKDPYFIIPLLMGVTMFVQQKMGMTKVKDPVQQQQQKIMLIMPVVFTWICIQMPSGMVLYWFVNNILGIGQQWLVNRHTERLEAAEQKA